MLRLSKKSDYGLIAMKHLAIRQDAGTSSSAREISEAYAIPLELLAKVLQRLARARLLVSVQGTRGGYRLGRAASAISVADVIQAVDGPVAVTACAPDDHTCEQYGTCSIRDPLWKLKGRIVEMLATVTVAELSGDSMTPAVLPAAKVSRMVFVPSGGGPE
jgi:Rrf2 family protein